MEIHYLGAEVRLSKTFEEIAPGNYKHSSYPHVADFISLKKEIDSLESFYLNTQASAIEGMCLVKGKLDQQLKGESRAGHTDPKALTEWICLDIDCTVTDQTPTEFITSLDPAFEHVSFVFQKSASQGIRTHEGWRGHFFILLDEPCSPQLLKQWLIKKNFELPLLREQLALTASGGALRYPLDVSTCQNDKLIYIAPPVCVNFDDPVKDRFELHTKDVERASIDFSNVSEHDNEKAVREHIAELRKTAKLPKKDLRLRAEHGTTVLTNPDPMQVTGVKEARDFVYLNLNGGDSWAYFFPVNNPTLLYNFKDEPCLYMRDVSLDLFNQYALHDPNQAENRLQPFGLLWPADDRYYRGFANPATRELSWITPTGSKNKLRDFMVGNNMQPASGWAVPEWELTFDPSTEGFADFPNRIINTYKKSQYLKTAEKLDNVEVPPTIDKILNSICVEEEIKQHFLNWLACIFQFRMKTNTAWIFQGVQGTGKGVLFSRVITPLLGPRYCHEMTMDRLDDDYNAYLSENIVLFIDEAKIGDSRNGDRLLNRIKNLVTEPEQHIRDMRAIAVMRENYSNIILASNYDDIIPIEDSDRRFNVAPRQEHPIRLDYEDIVRIERELPQFANYLHSFQTDTTQVRKVILSEARTKLIQLSQTTVDSFFLAIRTGDLAYFTQYLDNDLHGEMEGVRYHDYSLVVKRWMENANQEMNVSRNELRVAYQFLQNTSISTTKFSRMIAKYNIEIVPVRIENSVVRGIRGQLWELSEEEREIHEDTIGDNVVRLRK